jgi:hypothetical protein
MKTKLLGLLACMALLGMSQAGAATVGNIEVCYYCSHNFDSLGILDGPTFEINNTSATAITNATFTANGDTYNVGTIAASSSVILRPGVSNDGGSHSGFWIVTGGILDTSDLGPDSNTLQFQLTGLFGILTADTGVFTPATSVQALSNDGLASSINFLGGPGNTDGPCNDCYGPDIVALINVADATATPLPAALPLFATGLGALGLLGWRRKRKNAIAA